MDHAVTAPIRRRTLVRLPADPARTDVKLGQRAPYEGEWVERPETYQAPIVDDEPCYWCDPANGPCRIHAAADLAALRSLLWYRGDLAGDLAAGHR